MVGRSATGIPAVCANEDPQTIAEALAAMDDGYRRMLLDAGRRDGRAREQAVATRALWWDSMPRDIRDNIECRVDAWRRDHPRVNDRETAARMVDMLLAKLRDHRSGAHRLGVAIRIPS